MRKLFIVVNEDRFFLSHRKAVAVEALRRGFDVTVVAKDTGRRSEVEAIGARMVDMPINPTGMNPLQELRTFRFLRSLYESERPDIVHHVGLKNILWGGLAAKMLGVGGVVGAVAVWEGCSATGSYPWLRAAYWVSCASPIIARV